MNPNPKAHRPHWKYLHRDWRIWVGVIVMLAAMAVYLMTGDLRWRTAPQPSQPVSAPTGSHE